MDALARHATPHPPASFGFSNSVPPDVRLSEHHRKHHARAHASSSCRRTGTPMQRSTRHSGAGSKAWRVAIDSWTSVDGNLLGARVSARSRLLRLLPQQAAAATGGQALVNYPANRLANVADLKVNGPFDVAPRSTAELGRTATSLASRQSARTRASRVRLTPPTRRPRASRTSTTPQR